MRPGRGAALWFFLFLAGTVFEVFSQQFIVTDAEGGIFRENRYLSFSLRSPGRLRLLLDGKEIYRGAGPAYPELGLPEGEEHGFTLSAEYYSPENELAESRSWHIYIDKKAPSPRNLEFRDTREGLRLVREGGGPGAKIRALADIEGTLVYFPDLGNVTPPAASFSALVWAEDLAGNFSEPVSGYFGLPPVKIENPVPGSWLNRQTLVITGGEGKNIYWTSDGSDPLEPGGSGRLYLGPVRVTGEGPVNLRAAWREAGGSRRDESVAYTVLPGAESVPVPESFGRAEETELREETKLELPPGWLWSAGGVPQTAGGINLRPAPLVKRVAAFHLAPENAETPYLYRFVFLLDGTEENTPPAAAVSGRVLLPLNEDPLYPAAGKVPPSGSVAAVSANTGSPLRLVSAGRRRAIIWPEVSGTLYYSWGGGTETQGSWLRGKEPLPVPPAGGRLNWFIIGDEKSGEGEAGFAGPYEVNLESLPGKRETVKGRIALRKVNERSGWTFASELLEYAPGLVNDRLIDVCDGEDIEWAFIGSGGKILERQRQDRLAPSAPRLSAPAEGSWNRGPVKLELRDDGDDDAVPSISARLRYASGRTEIIRESASMELGPSFGESAEVTVECFRTDSSGNRSPVVTRRFIVDPETVYVSPEPRALGLFPGEASEPGGMYNPFTSLEEALDYAQARNIRDIRITGKLELTKPLTLSHAFRIDGAWKRAELGGAAIILGNDFSVTLGPDAGLAFSGLALERKEGERPLIQAGENSTLEFSGVSVVNQGPLLVMEGGSCVINDSEISLDISGETRIAAFSASDSEVKINNSRVNLREDYSLLFNFRGGRFSAENSVFDAAGGRTAALVILDKTTGDFSDVTMTAAARDYASLVEVSGAEFFLNGGSLEAAAKDAGAVLIDNSASVIVDSFLRLESSFTARTLEIRGSFPLVQNTRFVFTGAAKKSEVFSGTGASRPPAGSIGGNKFLGFTHIWGGEWPRETLGEFNRFFAPPENPNSDKP